MNCAIIIYNYESIEFLKASVRQIRRYKNPLIDQRIIISEQSTKERQLVIDMFGQDSDITIVPMEAAGSGYSIDYIMRNIDITEEYVCTLDVDAFPVHINWLYVPITLIQERDLSFVGIHAEIEKAYEANGNFFCMSQYFRVGRTSTYKDLSLNAGFTKFDVRRRVGLDFDINWEGWSDDAVIAHWWEDMNYNNSKLTFGVEKYLDVAPLEGRYGRLSEGLVFHFGFSYNWKMVGDKEKAMGANYLKWIERINAEGLTNDMIDEMLLQLIPLERPVKRELWKDKQTTDIPEELNNLIERLKHD